MWGRDSSTTKTITCPRTREGPSTTIKSYYERRIKHVYARIWKTLEMHNLSCKNWVSPLKNVTNFRKVHIFPNGRRESVGLQPYGVKNSIVLL